MLDLRTQELEHAGRPGGIGRAEHAQDDGRVPRYPVGHSLSEEEQFELFGCAVSVPPADRQLLRVAGLKGAR